MVRRPVLIVPDETGKFVKVAIYKNKKSPYIQNKPDEFILLAQCNKYFDSL